MFSPKPRKKRNNLNNDSRYSTPHNRTGFSYLNGSRGRSDSKETNITNFKRAKHAVSISRSPVEETGFESKSSSDKDYEASNDFHAMGPGVRALRVKAIEFLFVHIYNNPPKTEWRNFNLVPTIMRTLQISSNSFSRVSDMLEGILEAQRNDKKFKQHLDRRGRKSVIVEYDYCAKVVYHAMATGQSIQSSTQMVNVVRRARGEEPISWSAMYHFVKNSDIIQSHRRQ
jgi:hypothetical protein